MKDEAEYLLEWIAFHKIVGTDYFYIYNNDSSDGTRGLLRSLEQMGICTHIEWPRENYPDNPQVNAYRHAISEFGHETEWLAIIDADEFIVPLTANSVSDILRENFAGAPSVLCNWKIFGSSGHERADDRLCIDRFARSSLPDFHSNRNVKSIVRPEHVEMAFIHNHYLKDGVPVLSDGSEKKDPRGQLSDPVYGHLQINHYACKSREEFMQKKRSKGLADHPLDDPNAIRSIEMFVDADRNDLEDRSARRFIGQVEAESKKLKAYIEASKENEYCNTIKLLDNALKAFT
jgi:hypothetical protein